jgi:hypothetical protein
MARVSAMRRMRSARGSGRDSVMQQSSHAPRISQGICPLPAKGLRASMRPQESCPVCWHKGPKHLASGSSSAIWDQCPICLLCLLYHLLCAYVTHYGYVATIPMSGMYHSAGLSELFFLDQKVPRRFIIYLTTFFRKAARFWVASKSQHKSCVQKFTDLS